NRHRAVGVDGDLDQVGMAAERFVGGVVYRFLDDVGGIGGPGIHPRQPLDRLYAPELLDRTLVVLLRHRHPSHSRHGMSRYMSPLRSGEEDGVRDYSSTGPG